MYYPSKLYSRISASDKTKYIYANNILVATVRTIDSTITPYYIHTDHLGSTNVVSSDTGTSEILDYYSYGSDKTSTGSCDIRRKYIGEYCDNDTSLAYLNARYYNSYSGRFISIDPMFWSPERFLLDPQSLNAYSYARNNPIILVDNNGEFWHVAIGAGVGAVIAGGITYWQTGDWNQTWKSAAGGAVAGALIAAVGPAAVASLPAAMGYGAVASMAGNSLTRGLNGEQITAETLATDGLIGGAGGGLGYGLGKVASAVVSKIKVNTVPKTTNGVFPKNPDELMSELPRDAKGYIYPNQNTRIRIETHGLGSNGEFIPRHSELHYHVDYRLDPTRGWSNSATKTITPPNWVNKMPKGFLPGEQFPGTTVNIGN